MKTIKCRLPNASTEINGVAFTPADDGSVVSGPVADDVADGFARIPGYEVTDVKVEPTAEEKAAAAAAAADAAKSAAEEKAAAKAATKSAETKK